jgi:hypothetical protein
VAFGMAEIDERDPLMRLQRANNTSTIALLNLRELARKTEEAAALLEGAGYRMLPGELMEISGRLTKIREALE